MVNRHKLMHIKFYRTVKTCGHTDIAHNDTANLVAHVVYDHQYQHSKNCWIYKVTK